MFVVFDMAFREVQSIRARRFEVFEPPGYLFRNFSRKSFLSFFRILIVQFSVAVSGSQSQGSEASFCISYLLGARKLLLSENVVMF